MIVRYDCGCVGIHTITNPEGHALLLRWCDGGRDEPDVGLGFRDMSGKAHAPVPSDEVLALVSTLRGLVIDGHQMREVRALLAPRRQT